MKRIAPIFIFLSFVLFLCGCSTVEGVSSKQLTSEPLTFAQSNNDEIEQINNNQINQNEVFQEDADEINNNHENQVNIDEVQIDEEDASTQTQPTLAERTAAVVLYIYENYSEYFDDRYINFGVENLVNAATEDELVEIERTTSILERAIDTGESLSQDEWQTATGASKTVFDLDHVLFIILNR